MQNLRERLAYVKGLAQARGLGEPERGELLLSEIVGLLEDLIEKVDSVSQRREQSVRQGGRTDIQDLVDGSKTNVENVLSCPSCRQHLAIGKELLAEETFEVTCPECSLVLQVM